MTGKQPFEAVVTEHGATVLRVCRVVLGPADADDAWSETFLAAMRAYPDLPTDANVEAWLVTIAHRKAIDLTRAAARRAIPVAQPPDAAVAPAADGAVGGLEETGRRLPLSGGPGLCRHRRHRGRQRGRGPQGRRRRHRHAQARPLRYHRNERKGEGL